jgi:hypothetical protein
MKNRTVQDWLQARDKIIRAAEICKQITALEDQLSELAGTKRKATGGGVRRKLSRAARAKIGAAMKARWAKRKSERK